MGCDLYIHTSGRTNKRRKKISYSQKFVLKWTAVRLETDQILNVHTTLHTHIEKITLIKNEQKEWTEERCDLRRKWHLTLECAFFSTKIKNKKIHIKSNAHTHFLDASAFFLLHSVMFLLFFDFIYSQKWQIKPTKIHLKCEAMSSVAMPPKIFWFFFFVFCSSWVTVKLVDGTSLLEFI